MSFVVQLVFGRNHYPVKFHDPAITPGRTIYSTCPPWSEDKPTEFTTRKEAETTAKSRMNHFDTWEVTESKSAIVADLGGSASTHCPQTI